jgi:hypothetical protein
LSIRPIVTRRKTLEYAATTHPIGRFKSRFFAALGYSAERWQELATDLRVQHLTQDAQPGDSLPEGQSFTIRAILKGPNAIGRRPQRVVRAREWQKTSLRHRLSGRHQVNAQPLDVVVLAHDMPAHGLRRGDLGVVVEIYSPDSIGVEFVAASGRTQALVTLCPTDFRLVDDDDLVAVRPSDSSNRRDG